MKAVVVGIKRERREVFLDIGVKAHTQLHVVRVREIHPVLQMNSVGAQSFILIQIYKYNYVIGKKNITL